MSKAYSKDLKERVIKGYEEGVPKGTLIEVFKLGISTLNRWRREYLETGSLEPKNRTRYRNRKVEEEE